MSLDGMNEVIIVERLSKPPIEKTLIEIVERKGIGHPDTLIDGIVEWISRDLCKSYYKKFKMILHHNVDKGIIAAGEAKPAFGGGELIKPIYILIAGRATKDFEGISIPTDKIALKAAKDYIKKHMRNLDPETDVIFNVKLGEGSTDLKDVFARRKGGIPMSNDTSFGIGFAPLTETESLVYNVERRIYNEFRKKRQLEKT